jgi:formate dehydrogenase maturation protein FdhE
MPDELTCQCEEVRALVARTGHPNTLRCAVCVDALVGAKNGLVRENAALTEERDRLRLLLESSQKLLVAAHTLPREMTAALAIDTLDVDPVRACRAIREELDRYRAADELPGLDVVDGRQTCPRCGGRASIIEEGVAADEVPWRLWQCEQCERSWRLPQAKGG